MKNLTVYGSSDDLIEANGIPGADEFYIGQSQTDTLILLEDDKPKLYIHCFYGYKNIAACWSFAVSQVDEDEPVPDWDIRILNNAENGYSTLLSMMVPDNVTMTLHKPTEESEVSKWKPKTSGSLHTIDTSLPLHEVSAQLLGVVNDLHKRLELEAKSLK